MTTMNMTRRKKIIYLVILTLLISFASVGAVVFTPGLPNIADYFGISNKIAQYTVTWYLVGYALGQLIYGPLTNRFGSISTIKIGASIAVLGSIGCILAYYINSYNVLIISRVVMALGAACGLKMTFTLSSKLFSHEESARVMGLLTMAFAITPGLGVYLGGILVTKFNWTSPFYLMVLYGAAIFLLSSFLPEMYTVKDHTAVQIKNIVKNYALQIKNSQVIYGGLLVGLGSSIVYVFAAVSPFIAMNKMHLTPSLFGAYNFIPCIGILTGSLASNHYGNIWLPKKSLKFGLVISALGVLFLLILLYFRPDVAISLFLPMIVIYFGFSFVFGNAAALALKPAEDKGNASAMMSFINMGTAFIMATGVGLFNMSNPVELPIIYAILVGSGFVWYYLINKSSQLFDSTRPQV